VRLEGLGKLKNTIRQRILLNVSFGTDISSVSYKMSTQQRLGSSSQVAQSLDTTCNALTLEIRFRKQNETQVGTPARDLNLSFLD
jgi:hypothetical protein